MVGFFPTHTSHPAHPHSFKLLNVVHKVLAWAASDCWILHGAHGGTSSKPSPGESQLATPLCACTPSEKNMNRQEHRIMGTQHFYIQGPQVIGSLCLHFPGHSLFHAFSSLSANFSTSFSPLTFLPMLLSQQKEPGGNTFLTLLTLHQHLPASMPI